MEPSLTAQAWRVHRRHRTRLQTMRRLWALLTRPGEELALASTMAEGRED